MAVDLAQQQLGVAGQHLHVPGDELARALAALDVELVHVPHQGLVLDQPRQQHVADVVEADGAVEVEQHAEGRAVRRRRLVAVLASSSARVSGHDEAGPQGPAPDDVAGAG